MQHSRCLQQPTCRYALLEFCGGTNEGAGGDAEAAGAACGAAAAAAAGGGGAGVGLGVGGFVGVFHVKLLPPLPLDSPAGA